MALWSLGPLLERIIGPMVGGFLIEAAGWRWVFWLIAIAVSQLLRHCNKTLIEPLTDWNCYQRHVPSNGRNIPCRPPGAPNSAKKRAIPPTAQD